MDAIRRPLGASTLDGVKRRTRAGMGRCQAGFCRSNHLPDGKIFHAQGGAPQKLVQPLPCGAQGLPVLHIRRRGPCGLTIALAENAVENGVEFRLGTEVEKIEPVEGGYRLITANGCRSSWQKHSTREPFLL